MQRSVLITAKRSIAALFLFCTAIVFGCRSQGPTPLIIYCNETFWYVMQDEALVFNYIYGFNVVLIPIRVPRTASGPAESLEIRTDQRTPAPWQSMPRGQTDQLSMDQRHRINPEIGSQIDRIAEESFGDLFLSDSQKQLEKLRTTALSADEFHICYLTLTMLVSTGNPHQFRSVKDVLTSNRKLGIVDPSLDGLGESSWNVLSRIVPGGESAIPMELVQLYERQHDLLEALEQKTVDAALVWNAISQVNFLLVKYADEYNEEYKDILSAAERKKNREALRKILQTMYDLLVKEKSFAQEIPLTENLDERCVVTVRLVALGSTADYEYCKRFADFMRSKQGKDILRRFGFIPE